ncbi:MAG: proline--tRNA ligase [Bacilli bacterium]
MKKLRQSLEFIPTLKEVSSDAVIQSHKILLRGGYAHQTAAGIYSYLPIGYRVIKKICEITRQEHDKAGCSELFLPVLQPKSLWDQTKRWDAYGDNLMKLKDRNERDFCLGPTHEEVITDIVKTYIKSYKKLPIGLYQIQTKFRDEFRPRFGLMRGREFIMKDLYTFHESQECLQNWYDIASDIYTNIFKRCGLDFVKIEADNGEIGGTSSHEFMALCEVGEDVITYCKECGYSSNQEASDLFEGAPCPKCEADIYEAKGIELGHIFQLGTKYSDALSANINNASGELIPIVMGCYGIGISRITMAVLEQHSRESKVMWPDEISPYDVHVIVSDVNNSDQMKAAIELETKFSKEGLECLVDDRDERMGSKIKDADLIGVPKKYIIGKDFENGFIEYRDHYEDSVLVATSDLLK